MTDEQTRTDAPSTELGADRVNAPENQEHFADETRVYELGYHILPTISEDDVPAEVTKLKESIESHNGRVIADEYPKRVELAYPMTRQVDGKNRDFSNAYFGWIKFELASEPVAQIEAAVAANNCILRSIVVKTTREAFEPYRSQPAPEQAQKEPAHAKKRTTAVQKEKSTGKNLSDEELDKTIDELVVE